MKKQMSRKDSTVFRTFSATMVAAPVFALLSACSPDFHPAAEKLADRAASGIGCGDLKAQLWTELYQIAELNASFPSRSEVERKLGEKLLARGLRASEEAKVRELASKFAALYEGIVRETEQASKTNDKPAEQTHAVTLARALAVLELGDESTPEKVVLQKSVGETLPAIHALAKDLEIACEPPGGGDGGGTEPQPTPGTGGGGSQPGVVSVEGAMLDGWKSTKSKSVYGLYKTVATSYQSCTAVDLPAFDSRTPDVEGVVEPSSHPPSAGRWRVVGDLNAFLRTNPYYKNYREPDTSCFDIEKNPLIYDFGGKPKPVTAENALDLFADAGYGSTALGVDCSGFVVTAHLVGGLKVKSDAPARPGFVMEIAARMIKDPQSSSGKFDCLKHVDVTSSSSIKAGDMIASEGHVVMVDSVGPDPFGINNIASAAQCTSANVSASRFNFTIMHSSPTKGAIGIYRVKASSYFPGQSDMRTALEAYAVGACKARFGIASSPRSTAASLIRHSGDAKCIDAKPVALRRSSCLKSCAASAM
jgi:hypothetical protein